MCKRLFCAPGSGSEQRASFYCSHLLFSEWLLQDSVPNSSAPPSCSERQARTKHSDVVWLDCQSLWRVATTRSPLVWFMQVFQQVKGDRRKQRWWNVHSIVLQRLWAVIVAFDVLPNWDFPQVKPEAAESAGLALRLVVRHGGPSSSSSAIEECEAVFLERGIPFHTRVKRKRRPRG